MCTEYNHHVSLPDRTHINSFLIATTYYKYHDGADCNICIYIYIYNAIIYTTPVIEINKQKRPSSEINDVIFTFHIVSSNRISFVSTLRLCEI
jgi:hypothetical protein